MSSAERPRAKPHRIASLSDERVRAGSSAPRERPGPPNWVPTFPPGCTSDEQLMIITAGHVQQLNQQQREKIQSQRDTFKSLETETGLYH